jgi:hypothetical protein
MVFIPKNSTLGQLGCAHIPTIILPLYGGPWCGHEAVFFVMIRMAHGTRPDSVRWIQKGSIFVCRWCVMLICCSCRVEVPHLGITLYVSCMFFARSIFRIRIVVLFVYLFIFLKRLYSVFVMNATSFQLSVGDSFDKVRRSRFFILDVQWIINIDGK